MELRHLRYFVAVAGSLSFSKAAGLLRVALVPSCLACLAAARLRFVALHPAPEPHVVGTVYRSGNLSPGAARFVAVLHQLAQ